MEFSGIHLAFAVLYPVNPVILSKKTVPVDFFFEKKVRLFFIPFLSGMKPYLGANEWRINETARM